MHPSRRAKPAASPLPFWLRSNEFCRRFLRALRVFVVTFQHKDTKGAKNRQSIGASWPDPSFFPTEARSAPLFRDVASAKSPWRVRMQSSGGGRWRYRGTLEILLRRRPVKSAPQPDAALAGFRASTPRAEDGERCCGKEKLSLAHRAHWPLPQPNCNASIILRNKPTGLMRKPPTWTLRKTPLLQSPWNRPIFCPVAGARTGPILVGRREPASSRGSISWPSTPYRPTGHRPQPRRRLRSR